MFKISGFFDEVSPKLEEQLAAMQTLGMRYLCPRNVNGKNIAQYSLQSFRQDVKPALLKQGVQLSSIGSPIGKIDLTDEKAYQAQLKQLRELLAIAQEMECAYIRVFSFFTAKAAGEDRLLERVAEKVNGFLKLAEGSGVTLIHENEKRIYGDTPEKARALYNTLNHPGFALCYDASNYIQWRGFVGSAPADQTVYRLLPYEGLRGGDRGSIGNRGGADSGAVSGSECLRLWRLLDAGATHAAICAAEKGVPPAPLCHQHQKGACVPAN